MSLRFSILLILIGAVLTFVIDHSSQGVDLRILGVVFLAGGIGGFVFSMLGRLSKRASRARLDEETPATRDDRREAVMRDRT